MRSRDTLDWVLSGSAIFGFIMDLFAFFGILGADLIIAPSAGDTLRRPHPPVLKFPVDAETLTFIVWLYVAIVGSIVCTRVIRSSQTETGFRVSGVSSHLLLGFFLVFAPILLVIWLWSFDHISAGFYVFLVPTMIYMGFTGYASLTDSYVGGYILLFGLGPTIAWFRAGYDWSFFWIVVITLISSGLGAGVGIALFVGGVVERLKYQGDETKPDASDDHESAPGEAAPDELALPSWMHADDAEVYRRIFRDKQSPRRDNR